MRREPTVPHEGAIPAVSSQAEARRPLLAVAGALAAGTAVPAFQLGGGFGGDDPTRRPARPKAAAKGEAAEPQAKAAPAGGANAPQQPNAPGFGGRGMMMGGGGGMAGGMGGGGMGGGMMMGGATKARPHSPWSVTGSAGSAS